MAARVFIAALAALPLFATGPVLAGGPLIVRGNGQPYVWSTTSAIPYRTDNGPLSASANEASARARVAAMFGVWQNVATSNISYARAGFINAVGAFAGGDVGTAVEYAAVEQDCVDGNQSPVVYDANGTILIDLGVDETSVIGFAGPCDLSADRINSGLVVMNGLFQDGLNSPVADLTAAEFDAAFVHEFGHFSGLDHSQVNVNCLALCDADDLTGLPTMFPFLVSATQSQLSVDDIAWISRLYPQSTGGTTFAGTHGTITGIVYFSDGESHAQMVNVIARRVDSGANQDRTHAVSVISGYKFRALHGNPLTGAQPSPFGSSATGDIGLFEIPLPAGSYTIEVESIVAEFTGGSGIGPYWIPMPGTAPAPSGPIIVGPGATASGNNVTLVGTQPRFDQFEGP
jgi:hypothetical protein